MSDGPASGADGGDIPELPPLPDITDTSYMASAFKAPPRNPRLSEETPQRQAKEADSGERERSEKKNVAERIDDAYAAAEARFMATYRDPLEEEVKWVPVRVRVPVIWWILLAAAFLAASSLFLAYATMPEAFSVHGQEPPPLVQRVAVVMMSVVGVLATFAIIRKPPFWSFLHFVLGLTAYFWGFGGVTLLTLACVSNFFLEAVDATSKLAAVRAVVPLALWGGAVLVIPIIVVPWLIPPWERRAAVLRLGTADTFWGAFAGVGLTMILPHAQGRTDAQVFLLLIVAILPVAGIFAMGVAISLPVRWPIPRKGVLPQLLGIVVTSFGIAVFLAAVMVPDVKPAGRVVLTILVVAFSVLGIVALGISSRAADPLRREDMEGLQDWVDADILHADEHEFMCDEDAIHRWAREALRRGVFLAARDFYRATSELAFTGIESERGLELAETVHTTRRKLESAGVPPRPDFMDFSEKPIFPDPLDR